MAPPDNRGKYLYDDYDDISVQGKQAISIDKDGKISSKNSTT